jgi:hypothetical protein
MFFQKVPLRTFCIIPGFSLPSCLCTPVHLTRTALILLQTYISWNYNSRSSSLHNALNFPLARTGLRAFTRINTWFFNKRTGIAIRRLTRETECHSVPFHSGQWRHRTITSTSYFLTRPTCEGRPSINLHSIPLKKTWVAKCQSIRFRFFFGQLHE